MNITKMNNLKTPKISILCPSYNHEKYVKYFIESVLNQTEQDFELIIVDDCSSDKNVEEIEKFKDPRIKLIKHEYNKGINAGLNTAFKHSTGIYCVFIASDDILEPNHLEVTSKYLDSNKDVGVFYCSLSTINKKNIIIGEGIQPNISMNRHELLKKGFMYSNICTSPGMTFRKSLFEKIYPLDISLVQYQDYQIHVSLLLYSDVYISDQKLVKYRTSGISRKSFMTNKRIELEVDKVMDTYLQLKDIALLENIFGVDLQKIGKPTKDVIPYFLGRLALLSISEPRKRWGYQTIMKFIQDKDNYDLLNEQYEFNFKEYLYLTKQFIDMIKILKIILLIGIIYFIISMFVMIKGQ